MGSVGFSRAKKKVGRRLRRKIDLKKTLFLLPNMITLAAVFCGFNAIRLAGGAQGGGEDLHRAAVLLIFAMLFDLLDGRVARLTKTESAFGLQLDSLADMISFGVAPAILVYQWVLYRHPLPGLIVAFMFVACAAARLARFNVLSSAPGGAPVKPGKYMLGLPTPPASGILISLVVADSAVGGAIGQEPHTLVLFVVTVAVSLLMVSNVRFRSFKDLSLNPGTVLLVLFVIGSSAFVWQRYKPQLVLIWLLSVYVFLGIAETVRMLGKRLRDARSHRDSLPPTAAE